MKVKTEEQLGKLQQQVLNYFRNEANPVNGLVPDNTSPDYPGGIASTGLSLTCGIIAAERGFLPRNQVAERTLATLRFLYSSRTGPEPEAAGHHGFYYSLLDMHKGRRAKLSGISLFDNAILFSGILASGLYFTDDSNNEREIRSLADELFLRADWQWILNSGGIPSKSWKPESGFTNDRWKGYDEAMLPLILGLGSPSYPLPKHTWADWTSTFEWVNAYGYEYLHAGPLFIHQIPHVWLDLREIADTYMQGRDTNYFENSVRATIIQQKYAIENIKRFEGYGKYFWGFTRSNGPSDCSGTSKDEHKKYLGFADRGAPGGPDDGTVSLWSAVTSLPFAPGIVLPMINHLLHEMDLIPTDPYGFRSAYNPTFGNKPHGWRSSWHYALDQGPAMPMIENHLSGFLWKLMSKSQYIVSGLERAGFSGGWLESWQSTIEMLGNYQGRG